MVHSDNEKEDNTVLSFDRRRCLTVAATTAATAAAALCTTTSTAHAIGELPETLNQAKFVQHAVVNVPDIEVCV